MVKRRSPKPKFEVRVLVDPQVCGAKQEFKKVVGRLSTRTRKGSSDIFLKISTTCTDRVTIEISRGPAAKF